MPLPLAPILINAGRVIVVRGAKWAAKKLARRRARKEAAKRAKELAKKKADAAKKKNDSCKNCQRSQDEKRKKLEQDAGVKQRTKGKTKHGELKGGMKRADKEFDNLNPKEVKEIDTKFGKGRTGKLDSGEHITVRPGSKEGPATIQIRNKPTGRQTEIRFPE